MRPYRDHLDANDAAARTRALAEAAVRLESRRLLRSDLGACALVGLLVALALWGLVLTHRGGVRAIGATTMQTVYTASQIALPLAVTLLTVAVRARRQAQASRWLLQEAMVSGVPWPAIKAIVGRTRERRTDGLMGLALALAYAGPIGWALTWPGGAALILAVVLLWAWVPGLFWLLAARPVFGESWNGGAGCISLLALLFAPLVGLLATNVFEMRVGLALMGAGLVLPIVLRVVFARVLAAEDRALDALDAAVALAEEQEGRTSSLPEAEQNVST